MEQEFENLPISRLVLRLGIPAMFAQFFNILYSIVDRAFVGHMPGCGEMALAGIGICAPILTALTAVCSLLGIGGASLMSICMGKKEYRDAEAAMNHAAMMLAVFSIVLTGILLVCEKPLLYALGCSDAIYPYAGAYFRIYVCGTLAVLCGTGMNQFILAFGNAKRGMAAVMLGAILNTILDPIFICGLHMGIRGAAIATVTAQICVLVFVLRYFFSEKAVFRLHICRPERRIMGKILKIGSLPFLIILCDNLLVISLNYVLRRYGGEVMGDRYISCAAVVQSFMVLVTYPAQGITSGCGTLYSYHYGAGNTEKVLQVFRSVFLLCAGYMAVLCGAAQLFPVMFAKIFVQDQAVAVLSASCIRRYTAGLLGVAVQYAIVDGLTAMGMIREALPISFFRKILYVVCVFLLPMAFPMEQVFYSETISDLAGASVTAAVFLFRIVPTWKNVGKKQLTHS